MDSFAALMLATEPPSEKLMGHKPQGKEEPLITRTMWKNMIGHAIFQSALLVWLTSFASGSAWLGLDYEAAGAGGRKLVQLKENTLVFTIFVSLQIFNLFNCRSVHDEWNVFENFGNSTVAQASGRFKSGKFIMGAFQKSLTSLIRQYKLQLEGRLELASF